MPMIEAYTSVKIESINVEQVNIAESIAVDMDLWRVRNEAKNCMYVHFLGSDFLQKLNENQIITKSQVEEIERINADEILFIFTRD